MIPKIPDTHVPARWGMHLLMQNKPFKRFINEKLLPVANPKFADYRDFEGFKVYHTNRYLQMRETEKGLRELIEMVKSRRFSKIVIHSLELHRKYGWDMFVRYVYDPETYIWEYALYVRSVDYPNPDHYVVVCYCKINLAVEKVLDYKLFDSPHVTLWRQRHGFLSRIEYVALGIIKQFFREYDMYEANGLVYVDWKDRDKPKPPAEEFLLGTKKRKRKKPGPKLLDK